jgi:hypothetical protein
METNSVCTHVYNSQKYAGATRAKREGYVSPGTFQCYRDGQNVLAEFSRARGLRIHAGRNKRLRALTERITGKVAA